MKRILILGVGNIGSRHLQGLGSLSIPSRITVVDPLADSRRVAERRWAEVNGERHRVSFHESVGELPLVDIDLAIIATPSSVRKEAFETLAGHLSVEYLLFEKVLFQKVSEYEEVEKEIVDKEIQAWVNCPRRVYDVYQGIRRHVDAGPIDIDVTGNDWGMGSNAVHFIDLFSWLTGSTVLRWDTGTLEDKTIPSKRDGFEEFVGKLGGVDGDGNAITLRCFEDGPSGLSVRITTPEHRWMVNETSRTAIHETVNRDGDWTTEKTSVQIPFQSELTGEIAEQILTTGGSDLVGYDESSSYHVTFIKALIAHLNEINHETVDSCPIT